MLVEERRQKLRDLICTHGFASLQDLARFLKKKSGAEEPVDNAAIRITLNMVKITPEYGTNQKVRQEPPRLRMANAKAKSVNLATLRLLHY